MNVLQDLPDKNLLRPDEVAEYLRVSKKTVHRWVKKGTLDAIKINNLVRIPRSAVVALLETRSRTRQKPDDPEVA